MIKKRCSHLKITATILIIVMFFEGVCFDNTLSVRAADKTLTIDMVKAAAVANSTAYENIEAKIITKQASLSQAIRSIKEKKRNMATFRWSPLLSFKFPEKANLAEASEFTLKPISIQAQIDVLEHQLTDQKLSEYEAVSNLYVDIVVLEDTIAFNKERLESMEKTLERNRARLRLGEAKQADIDTMEKSVKALTNKITSDTRSYENSKKKLGKKIGMDISTGYKFENPFKKAEIPRKSLDSLKEYTIEHDQNYYNAAIDAQTALLTLDTNYSLMSGQYGSDMNLIAAYVNQARSGQKVNKKAFKKQYDNFLQKIDSPWQGKRKILFIRIPREWFKGQIDGIRYVEDEPYALYEAALEYQDALNEKNSVKAELEQQVEDTYNNYVSLKNAYNSSIEDVKDAKKQLEADRQRNLMGELTYEEYQSSQEDYEELQNAMYEALAIYSRQLYSFDRLTCGAVSKYLEEETGGLKTGKGGQSYIEEEYVNGAYYYIENIIQEQQFKIGVYIPDDYETDVTEFELWCDDVQIGERTAIGETIRHLGLAKENISSAKIRLYNDGKFVDECEIDPENYSGPLEVIGGYDIVTPVKNEVGTYAFTQNDVTGMVSIELMPEAVENIGAYVIKDANGNALLQSEPIDIKDKFVYLSLIMSSLDELTIEFYDDNKALKYKGYFDAVNGKLMRYLD